MPSRSSFRFELLARPFCGDHSMISLKRALQALPLLSILGLAGCIGSAISDLLINHVDLTPANPTIATGATQQFMLSATYLDGTTDHESPTKTAWFVDNAA